MPRTKLKLIFTLFFVFLVLFNSFCFAEDLNNGIMLISEDSEQQNIEYQLERSDLYISENKYSIKNIITLVLLIHSSFKFLHKILKR